jgi:hypothetical protein
LIDACLGLWLSANCETLRHRSLKRMVLAFLHFVLHWLEPSRQPLEHRKCHKNNVSKEYWKENHKEIGDIVGKSDAMVSDDQFSGKQRQQAHHQSHQKEWQIKKVEIDCFPEETVLVDQNGHPYETIQIRKNQDIEENLNDDPIQSDIVIAIEGGGDWKASGD